jgi:hypothetical protein
MIGGLYSRLTASATAIPPTMGVATDSSGEVNTPWGSAKDHGMIIDLDLGSVLIHLFFLASSLIWRI